MKPTLPPPLFLILLFLLFPTIVISVSKPLPPTPSPTSSPSLKPPSPTSSPSSTPSSSSSSPLDPSQLKALESLNIPTTKNPCSQPSFHNATICDSSSPFRHVISLTLSNCSPSLSVSSTALKSLSTTLQTLHLHNCPSLHRISGVGLSRLRNLTDLTLSNVQVKASGPYVVLAHMTKLKTLTISNANLTGFLPRHLHSNLTHIDLSSNQLKGNIPTSITMLDSLENLNLSSNGLKGEIPSSIGDLISLKNLSLASNSFSGSIPDSMSAIPGLVHVDLSSNQLNGSIPKFMLEIKSLKYLNLENNDLRGVVPFNLTFMKRLEVLKVGGNSNLCYNHSVLSSKLKLGIAPCDKYGMPMSPPPAKDDASSSADDSSDSDYDDSDDGGSRRKDHHHGPNKLVLGVAIALSSIVFLIVFLILCSKCCR